MRQNQSPSAYEYALLRDESTDARLFDLLPGRFDEDLRIKIFQTQLVKPVEPAHPHAPQPRLSLYELIETLPPEWEVHETLAGRYVFRNRSSSITSWVHPDTEFNREHYEWWRGAHPSCEAISYAWGSIEDPATVRVEHEDGHQAHSTLQVPENLALALKYLRFPDRARTLWADSISINQANLPERNSHVKRMSGIYKLAYRVVAWLGPPSDNRKLAVASLNRYSAQVDYTSGLKRISAPNATHPAWHVSARDVSFDEATWTAILDLSKGPWSDRLWVMQETQLASEKSFLLCGSDYVEQPRFRRAAMCLRDLPHVPSAELVSRTIELERLIAPIANTEVPRLLSRAHQRLCSDQRDKIYGILALASPKLLSLIQPQYDQPVGSVYRDAFEAIVKQTQRLEILSYCIHEPARRSDLASWVPDWSYFPLFPLGHRITYNLATVTAGYTRVEATFRSKGVLEVAGVHFGTVHEVKGAPPTNTTEGLTALGQWASQG